MDVARYWDKRYRSGRTSGPNSRGEPAEAKAAHIRHLIERERVTSIIDWGCGDGGILELVAPQVPYLGLDVSPYILGQLRDRFPHYTFQNVKDYRGRQRADLAMSLNVLFHQVEPGDHETHLRQVFSSSDRLVLVQASDYDGGQTARHVVWRRFTPDVERWFPEWHLASWPSDPTQVGFYLYRKTG